MTMYHVATGRGGISYDKEQELISWLRSTYGDATRDTWYRDMDYDLTDIVMIEEIYTMYKLKFGN